MGRCDPVTPRSAGRAWAQVLLPRNVASPCWRERLGQPWSGPGLNAGWADRR